MYGNMGRHAKSAVRTIGRMSKSAAVATGVGLAKVAASLAGFKKRKTYSYKGQGSAPATRAGSRMGSRGSSRGGSGTVTPASYTDTGGGAELTKVSMNYGHAMKHDLKHAWKMITANKQAFYTRYQNVNRFQSVNNGAQAILQSQSAPGQTLYLPVHLYDITSATHCVLSYEAQINNVRSLSCCEILDWMLPLCSCVSPLLEFLKFLQSYPSSRTLCCSCMVTKKSTLARCCSLLASLMLFCQSPCGQIYRYYLPAWPFPSRPRPHIDNRSDQWDGEGDSECVRQTHPGEDRTNLPMTVIPANTRQLDTLGHLSAY